MKQPFSSFFFTECGTYLIANSKWGFRLLAQYVFGLNLLFLKVGHLKL